MRSRTIYDTRRFTCTSYGNGLAYVLARKNSKESVLFQGDDATQFSEELDNLSSGRLPLSDDDVLGVLWTDYHVAASEGAEQ